MKPKSWGLSNTVSLRLWKEGANVQAHHPILKHRIHKISEVALGFGGFTPFLGTIKPTSLGYHLTSFPSSEPPYLDPHGFEVNYFTPRST